MYIVGDRKMSIDRRLSGNELLKGSLAQKLVLGRRSSHRMAMMSAHVDLSLKYPAVYWSNLHELVYERIRTISHNCQHCPLAENDY